MTVQRKAYGAKVEAVGDRQVRVICSTEDIDRAGEIVVQSGIDVSNYQKNPIVLWQHDVNMPVGRADIGIMDGKVSALVDFAPAGVSAKADEICGLVKSGIINGVSIGFNPIETAPMDPGNPKKGPQKYLRCELAEFSFVSVPANPNALVIERQHKADGENWKVGASRNLPLDEDSSWDGPAAQASIFEKAGFDGDNPDTAFARKGFLVYDAAAPKLEGSYKLPFAKVKDGRLTAVASGIRAAASRLPQTDIPDDVQKTARAVIDHYEAKMSDKSSAARVTKDGTKISIKGLYDVAQLAYVLQSLGYIEDAAEWEAEIEGDNSPVPALLAGALRSVADALLAMTAEEVSELLEEEVDEAAITKGLPASAVQAVKSAKAPLAKLIAAVKAGRAISAANAEKLGAACDHMQAAIESCKSATEACSKAHDHVSAVVGQDGDEDDDAGDASKSLPPAASKGAVALDRRQRLAEVLQRQAS